MIYNIPSVHPKEKKEGETCLEQMNKRQSQIFEKTWHPFLFTGISTQLRRKKVAEFGGFLQKCNLIPHKVFKNRTHLFSDHAKQL